MWELDQVRRVRRVGPRSLGVTIPPIIRAILKVNPGDSVAFDYKGEGENRRVTITKLSAEANLYSRVLKKIKA